MSDRLTVDTITSDQLDALYDDRDRLGYEVQQWKDTYGEHALRDTLARLNGAEAAVERVRTLHRKANNGDTCVYCAHGQRLGYDTTWPCDTIRALDELKEQPAAPCVQHPNAPAIGGICGGCTQYPSDMAKGR